MSNLVIVAIPDENDRVWKVSSEKIPHLTLLFLGDADKVSNTEQIVKFVEHAANTTLRRFYLPVDRRDELGEDKADTLIFKKGRYDYKVARDFRVQLLKDNNIRTAYDSTEQHEGPWMPHLTLGYPANPAKADDTDRDFGFYDVGFNKIAVWVDDYDGPEFLLKDFWDEWDTMEAAPMDVAWGDTSEAGSEFMLKHYGVKGMRWGQRKDETRKGWLDPEGRDLGSDVAKTAAGLIFPPFGIIALPSNIRLGRAAGRHLTTASKEKAAKKDDAKFEKVAKSQEGFAAIHNGSLEHANRAIGSINKKYSQDLTKNPAAKKKYDAEVLKAMQEAYRDSANRIGNKAGTKHLDVEFHNNGMDFAIKVKDGPQKPTVEKVKHAATIDDDDVVTFSGTIKRASTGHILGFSFEDFDEAGAEHSATEDGAEFMVHRGMMSPDHFLEHYGVKGMRWGQRNSREVPAAVAPQAASRVRAGDKRKTKVDVEGGENHPASDDALKVAEATAKLKKSGVKTLTNKELQEMAKRLQLENQVKDLTSHAGKKFVKGLLKNEGKQEAVNFGRQKIKKRFA